MDKLLFARQKINEIDKKMAALFCERMNTVKIVAEYKAENALPVFDAKREEEVIERNIAFIEDSTLVPHYTNFLKNTMIISRSYQAELYPNEKNGIIYAENGFRKIRVDLKENAYDIILGCGAILCAKDYFNLNRKVLIVTDDNVPDEYAQSIAKQCDSPFIYTIKNGESSKNMRNFEEILSFLAQNTFTRTDCVVAVGGGVVGDLAGFVAASYMRGIDFYNVPSTLLSQVDSSIGGKVAIDLGGYKNIVGAFYQPKCVIIDPELLLTLDIRQIRAGLAEALKMACTSDKILFEMFENDEYLNDIEEVIFRSLLIKRGIIERDEHEGGERKILNFGHTIGHAIESTSSYLHGECVALGMLFMCSDEVRKRLYRIIDDMGLPTDAEIYDNEIVDFIMHDKKADGSNITITFVDEIGKAKLIKMPIDDIKGLIKPEIFGGIQ